MELDLVEVDGKKYEKVKVRELTEASLTFMHQAGTMSVPLNQLKPDMQMRLGYDKGVPVMAMSKGAGGVSGGVGLDQEMEEVEKKITQIRAQLGTMKRTLTEETVKVRSAEITAGGDPTIHRQAAAALQVQINVSEVELQGLMNKRLDLTNKLRMKQGR
jgi:hypothetical protein